MGFLLLKIVIFLVWVFGGAQYPNTLNPISVHLTLNKFFHRVVNHQLPIATYTSIIKIKLPPKIIKALPYQSTFAPPISIFELEQKYPTPPNF